MKSKRTEPRKRHRQEHATEVELVEVKHRRLGKRIKFVPVVTEPSPAKIASSSKEVPSLTEQPESPKGSPVLELDPPAKISKARRGKVRS
jgi:hypothetical protein